MLNEIIKVDLHIHSKASLYKEDENIIAESDVEHLDILFGKLQDNGVNLFSITDHNILDADLYNAITKEIDKGQYPQVKGVIAGIEFDVEFDDTKKPCHIMAYFDAKTSSDYKKIELGADNPTLTKETKYKREKFEEILKKIGLPVVLIAYQRKSLDPLQEGGTNSISDAVSNVPEMIQMGYISGLDLQKPSVEGILRNNLHDLPEHMRSKVAMLMASDCHEWSAYPAHHAGHDKTTVAFSKIKALPTFKGLLMALTSPETRFSRIENTSQTIIKSFSYGEGDSRKTVELSSGINVIVGENGSGKSTLLDFLAGEGDSSHEKKIISKNHLVKDDSSDNKEYIRQAELIDQYQNGDLTSYGIYKDAFPDIDTTDFSQELRQYIQLIREKVGLHINASVHSKSTTADIEFVERKATFNVAINTGQLSIANSSIDSDRFAAVTRILRELGDESKNPYYTLSEKNELKKIIDKLNDLLAIILTRENINKNIAEVQNRLIYEIKQYTLRLKQLTTAEDQETEKYEQSLQHLRLGVLQRVKAKNGILSPLPPFPDFTNLGNINSRSIPIGGFVFHSYATFVDEIDSLEENLCEQLFNKGSRIEHFSDLTTIDTQEKWISCVRGATRIETIESCLTSSLNRFIIDKGNVKHEIKLQGTGGAVRGSTLGEQALVYYEALTDSPSRSSTIFFFDQPEDNISNKKIVDNLNSAIGRLRDFHQVIFVTHNPLMVVNLDVDNVIFLETVKIGKDRILELSAFSGCLEDEKNTILEKVADQMDGGEEAVEKRLKRYGR
jgi:energy-coupling factor transporter ATP-binding protein EcfA2